MKRLAARLAIVTTMAVSMLPAFGTSATAAGELGLSNDGVHWGSTLEYPLFDSAFRWVPGDSQTRSFHARNQTDQLGVLAVDILGTDNDALLQTGDLAITARSQGETSRPIRTSGRHRLLSDIKVPARSAERIKVTVSFDSSSRNVSQSKALKLRFRVLLAEDVSGAGPDATPGDGDASPPSPPSSTGGSGGAGFLPGTGGPALWLLTGGLALLLGGAFLVRQRSEVRDG